MIKRLNYTKRQKIKSEHVGIAIREISGAAPVATVSVSLDDYELPVDAKVMIEAYRSASYMRIGIGTVADYSKSHEFVMSEFSSPEGVLFRVKVIGPSSGLQHEGPLLYAVADMVRPREGDEQDSDSEKLIRFIPADLGGEIWRLDFEDGPVILFERDYWNDRSQIVRSGWFFPLVLPTVLRESLRQALDDNYRATDDDDWRSLWLRFALTIPGDGTLPGEEDVEEWIDAKVAAFCRGQKMKDRFEPAIKQGGQ
jgi:hypothetical protein